jgi:rhodanese-related sulfurtransferase
MNILVTCVLGIALAGAGATADAAEPAPALPAPAVAIPGVSAAEIAARLERRDADLVIVDVRTAEEFADGHLPDALNVPLDQLPAKLGELAPLKDKDVVLYCRTGRRSQLAARLLREAGFTRLLQLEGNYPAWEAAKNQAPAAPAPQGER